MPVRVTLLRGYACPRPESRRTDRAACRPKPRRRERGLDWKGSEVPQDLCDRWRHLYLYCRHQAQPRPRCHYVDAEYPPTATALPPRLLGRIQLDGSGELGAGVGLDLVETHFAPLAGRDVHGDGHAQGCGGLLVALCGLAAFA